MFNWLKKNCNCKCSKSEITVNYSEDTSVNVWHDPILKVGDFVGFSCKRTNVEYFLFVVEITPHLLRLGAGSTEISHKIDGKANGCDKVNEFINRNNIKKLF